MHQHVSASQIVFRILAECNRDMLNEIQQYCRDVTNEYYL